MERRTPLLTSATCCLAMLPPKRVSAFPKTMLPTGGPSFRPPGRTIDQSTPPCGHHSLPSVSEDTGAIAIVI
jgi:hypothetical protein